MAKKFRYNIEVESDGSFKEKDVRDMLILAIGSALPASLEAKVKRFKADVHAA